MWSKQFGADHKINPSTADSDLRSANTSNRYKRHLLQKDAGGPYESSWFISVSLTIDRHVSLILNDAESANLQQTDKRHNTPNGRLTGEPIQMVAVRRNGATGARLHHFWRTAWSAYEWFYDDDDYRRVHWSRKGSQQPLVALTYTAMRTVAQASVIAPGWYRLTAKTYGQALDVQYRTPWVRYA